MSARPEDFGMGMLIERINMAVIVAEAPSGRIVLWNRAAEQLFGYTEAEALQMSVDLLMPEELVTHHQRGMAAYATSGQGSLIDSGRSLQLPARKRDGGTAWVDLSLYSATNRRERHARYVLALLRDITDRRAAEAARTALAIQEVLDRIDEPVLATNTLQRFTYANPAACRLLGVALPALLGKRITEILLDERADVLQRIGEQALTSQHKQEAEVYSASAGGWYHLSVYPSATGLTVGLRRASHA